MIRAAKFGLVAAMLAMVSTVLAVPAAAAAPAAPAVAAVQSASTSDVGINASFDCYYQYDLDEFRWDCWVYSGYVRTYVSCASGYTYYTPWYSGGYYFWQYVACAGYWTNAGVEWFG